MCLYSAPHSTQHGSCYSYRADTANGFPSRYCKSKRTDSLLIRAILVAMNGITDHIPFSKSANVRFPVSVVPAIVFVGCSDSSLIDTIFRPGNPSRLSGFNGPRCYFKIHGVACNGISWTPLRRLNLIQIIDTVWRMMNTINSINRRDGEKRNRAKKREKIGMVRITSLHT